VDSLIEKEMQSSYLDYAMSVIIGRALPDARDGLKPAQRRILYAMYRLNNVHDQPTKKSARVVGEVIGKYHPHGDIAAYETLIRMAQNFTMNHTLVEGQGNMGSIDGDPPAAQRYTEVRLNPLAEEMLDDIDKKCVPLVPNFDNTEEEPLTLPTKVPSLLINGASGIAVGVATSIMQHNMVEVCDAIAAYLDNYDITKEEILKYIKGPDFPTGGTVFYNEALMASYINGRGSCTIRGKLDIEEKNGKKSIVVTEIPYTVNKSSLVQKIAELVKDKKILGIADLRDESGKEGIRIVIDLRRDAEPDTVINTLYRHTQLQITLPVINIAVIGKNLITLNIKDFIKVFVEYRIEVIKKRTAYELEIASDRLHIVDGIIIAINDINGVIDNIKRSSDVKEARTKLMEIYSLSEKQANAILEMKLSKLTNLERDAFEAEKSDLEVSIKNFNEILSDENKVNNIIREETALIKSKYGRQRRTYIEKNVEIEEIENEDLIADEDTTIILTKNNYIKRLPTDIYKSQGRGGKGIKSIELREGDFVKQIISCKTKDYLLLLTNKGRSYWLKAYQVPEEGRYSSGKAAINIVKLLDNEIIEKIVNTRTFSNSFLNMITRGGTIKRVNAEKFSKPRSNGILAMPIRNNDYLADVCVSDGKSDLFIATKNGKALRFSETQLRPIGRSAHGVRGIRLSTDDIVVNLIQAKESDLIATVTENGYGKLTELKKYRLQHRGGKGVINLKIKPKTGKVVKSLNLSEKSQILLINSKGLSIQFPVNKIRVTGRSASGVRLMKLDSGSRLVDAQELLL
jgi:DNA gyrase subunit A